MKRELRVTESARKKKQFQVKCWKRRGGHYLNKCHERINKDASVCIYIVYDDSTLGYVAIKFPCIYTALDNS